MFMHILSMGPKKFTTKFFGMKLVATVEEQFHLFNIKIIFTLVYTSSFPCKPISGGYVALSSKIVI
jgi:hypothetical protein